MERDGSSRTIVKCGTEWGERLPRNAWVHSVAGDTSMSLEGQESVCRNCSGALVQEVKKVLTGGDRPTHQAMAFHKNKGVTSLKWGYVLPSCLLGRRARAAPLSLQNAAPHHPPACSQARANFMIKIGDVLEGRLLSMEKAKPFDLPMAIHIQHLERTLASSSRVLAKAGEIWPWVITYTDPILGRNTHAPPILRFTKGTGFRPTAICCVPRPGKLSSGCRVFFWLDRCA